MTRPRLLVLASPVQSHGGGLRHIAALARAACEGGWRVRVDCLRWSACPPVAGLLDAAVGDVRVQERTGGVIAGFAWPMVAALRAAREGPVVVYASLPQAMIAAAVARQIAPRRIHLVAGVQGRLLREDGPRATRILFRHGLRIVFGAQSTRIVAVSEATVLTLECDLGLDIPRSRVDVVGNVAFAVGDAPWVAGPAQPRTAGPRVGPPAMGIVARLSHEKGVDIALRALAATPDLALDICGDGPERGALERLAAALGVGDRVRFLGWRDNVGAVMSSWAALILPSRTEGFPLVLLEAAWSGTPVIATRVGGVPDYAAQAGGVHLVDAEDVAGLAAAMAVTAAATAPQAPDPRAFGWAAFRDGVLSALATATRALGERRAGAPATAKPRKP